MNNIENIELIETLIRAERSEIAEELAWAITNQDLGKCSSVARRALRLADMAVCVVCLQAAGGKKE